MEDKEMKGLVARMHANGDQLMETIADSYDAEKMDDLFNRVSVILEASELSKLDRDTVRVFMLQGMFSAASIVKSRMDTEGLEP
jgi:hypothetical protein